MNRFIYDNNTIKILLKSKDNQEIYTIIDKDDEWVLKHKWYLSCFGYARSTIKVDGKQVLCNLHRLVFNTPEGLDTDHINGDRLDNRKSNLRAVTRQQNMHNRVGPNKNNTSGCLGVSWDKVNNKWRAIVNLGRTKYLNKRFTKFEDAKAAVFEAKRSLGFYNEAYRE